MSILRPYQQRDYEKIVDLWKTDNSVLYQLPTGGGKSLIIEHLVLNYQTEKILILAHKRELVFQMKKRLEENGLNVGIIIGNLEENIDANIIVASIRTVTREKRIGTILEKEFDKIIIDEAHHIRTSSYENVLDQYFSQHPKLKILGVTATPYRKDKKALNKYFKNLICSDSVQELQDQGYLAKYKVFYTPVKELNEEVKESGNDYQLMALSHFMMKPQMLQFLADSYKQHGGNKQMIIFCVDKKHAKAVTKTYQKEEFTNLAHIDSDTDLGERAEILTKFANNEIQIITCIETLTEGVDLPETKCIQLARPTKSLVLYMQMVGRGGRPKQDGSECIILDNAGCTIEHKLPNSPKEWSLNPLVNPNNPTKKHKILGKRKNGTFTDDEEEMEGLELIEMTNEKYVMNIDDGIEKAKNQNKEYDDKCRKILIELSKFIVLKSKNQLKFKIEDIKSDYFDKEKLSFEFNREGLKLLYKKYYKQFIIDPSFYIRIYSEKDFDKYNKLLIMLGNLTTELTKDKNKNYINEQFALIQEIQELKINIGELENLQRDFKEKQLRVKLENHLIKNNIITIKKDQYISLSTYFKNFYYRQRAVKLQFSKNKLMSNNEITFTLDDGNKKIQANIKPEKVVDMLKNIEWE